MNLSQFLERWPEKDSRLFLLAGGKDHDRLSIYYMICDRWRSRVDPIDFQRLHNVRLQEVLEACRYGPLNSKFRVVAATEVKDWEDAEGVVDEGSKRMARWLTHFPRDVVLVISSSAENPLTKNDFAQQVIRKGYWVVLKPVDVITAASLLDRLTGWDEDLRYEVVSELGTSPATLIGFVRTVRLAYNEPTEEQIRSLLVGQPGGTAFELVESVIRKDLPKALQLTPNVPPGQFVGALDRKMTSLLQFMSELRKGRTPKEAALNLHLPGFIVHGLYEATKRWSPQEILDLWPVMAENSIQQEKPGSLEVLVRRLVGA